MKSGGNGQGLRIRTKRLGSDRSQPLSSFRPHIAVGVEISGRLFRDFIPASPRYLAAAECFRIAFRQ